jgi:hypothetical protein
MSLIIPDRMQTLLGSYCVGSADCLTDPGLVAIAQDYRRACQARMKPIDADGIKMLPATGGAEYHVSLKIDGEFNCLVYDAAAADCNCILVNPGGTVRAGLPFLANIASRLAEGGCKRAVIAGELWYNRPERPRVHDVVRVARNPQSEEEVKGLSFAAFDIIHCDTMPILPSDGFAWAWAQLSEWGLEAPPATWCKQDGIRREFDRYLADGMEGIVIRSSAAGSFKVKPRHTIDAVVVGYTEQPTANCQLVFTICWSRSCVPTAAFRSSAASAAVSATRSGATGWPTCPTMPWTATTSKPTTAWPITWFGRSTSSRSASWT